MSATSLQSVLRDFRRRLLRRAGADESDHHLLERFAGRRDEAAFAALVRRHGPLVLGVGRRLLRNEQDAEEVFQAAFLALARRAASGRWPRSVAGWLYRVAYHLAMQVRGKTARRRELEKSVANAPREAPPVDASWREVCAVLDEELCRLPEKYRAPLLLCYFEGRTRDQAAVQVGWSVRTLHRRLERGLSLLRTRLTGRGVELPAALLAAGLAQQAAEAGMSALVFGATVRAALGTGADVSTRVAALAQEALKAMAMAEMKVGTLVLMLGVVLAGVGVATQQVFFGEKQPDTKKAATGAMEPSKPKKQQQPRTDRYGDPLPPAVVARLGTVRFRQGSSVHIIRFSPDGKTLLLGGTGGGLALWETATGRKLHDFPLTISPFCAALSSDGKTLASGEMRTALWDIRTGKHLKDVDKNFAASMAFAAERNMLAVGTDQGVDLWDAATGKRIRQLKHGATVRAVTFASADKSLASGGGDGIVRLWDVASGQELRRWKAAQGAPGPYHLAAAPTGPWLALADGKLLRLLHVDSGKEIRLLGPDPYQRGPVAFSRDGKILASAHDGGAIHLWDPSSATETLRWKTAQTVMFHSLAFTPDGKTLVSAGDSSSAVQWWDVASGKEIPQPHVGHRGSVKAVGFSRDGRDLFSLGADGAFMCWKVADGKNHGRLQLPLRAGAAFSPDGKMTLSVDVEENAGRTFSVRLRDSGTGKELRSLGKVPWANLVAFTSDGNSLAVAEADFKPPTVTVSVRDVNSGKQRHRFSRPGGYGYLCLAFSPDGKKVAAGSGNAERPNFRLWDLETAKEIPSCDPDHWVGSITFSPDGTLVALGSGDDQKACVSIWKLATATQLQRFTIPPIQRIGAPPSAVVTAFSPSGRFLVVGASRMEMFSVATAAENTVGVWEIASGKQVAALQGQQSGITALSYAPDGRSVASGGGDSTILIWEVIGMLRNGKRPQPLTAAALAACWRDLAGADAAQAYQAIADLVLAGDAAVTFLKTRVSPVSIPDAQVTRQATRFVGDLNSDAFNVREKAAAELEKIGNAAMPALHKALAERPSLETRRRVERILASVEGKEALAHLPKARALEALELIATSAARELLESLSQGDPGARLTQEARGARRRLGP